MLLWWLRYGRKLAIVPQEDNNFKPNTNPQINLNTKKDMKLNTTLILAAATLSAGSLQAAATWTNGSADGEYGTAGNWNPMQAHGW